jgi:hypothetical protein
VPARTDIDQRPPVVLHQVTARRWLDPRHQRFGHADDRLALFLACSGRQQVDDPLTEIALNARQLDQRPPAPSARTRNQRY